MAEGFPEATARAAMRTMVPGGRQGVRFGEGLAGLDGKGALLGELQEVAVAVGAQDLHGEGPQGDALGGEAGRHPRDLEAVRPLREAEGGEGLRVLAQRRPRVAALATGHDQGERAEGEEAGGLSHQGMTHQRMNRLRSWSRTRGSSLWRTSSASMSHAASPAVAGLERDVFEDGLEHGGQATGADVLGRLVDLGGEPRELADRVGR